MQRKELRKVILQVTTALTYISEQEVPNLRAEAALVEVRVALIKELELRESV